MKAQLGKKSPLLAVSDWVQGDPVNLDQLTGKVVLIEVFQVNCPGCFLYSLPMSIDLFYKYADRGLIVLGIATAFEDFDKNTLDNLVRLATKSEVVGETHKMLMRQGKLSAGRLPYNIPYPLAMDILTKRHEVVTDEEIIDFIRKHAPNFEQGPPGYQQEVRKQVQQYFESLIYRAETFERFELKGTPSHIVIDKQGILRECVFGAFQNAEDRLVALLEE